ncbi:MAG: sulfate adenylyltransferase, partial [Blastocatellia bacterium]
MDETSLSASIELISPYGETLANLMIDTEEQAEARAHAGRLAAVQLAPRAVCDLELLAVGAFSPLDRFMGEADFRRVVEEMRLSDGRLFPIPIMLPIPDEAGIRLDREITLRDAKNDILAVMRVEEIFEFDWREVARRVLGTVDTAHPMAAEFQRTPARAASGRLRVISLPRHFDFGPLRLTPAETRARLAAFGRRNVVAFQTRNPLHRAHEELTRRAIEQTGGVLLLHPVVGVTKPGDVDHFSRVRTYRALTERYYPRDRVLLSLLPLAMRMAGPREALWHAIIRRNYGANHFIVGRDHAGPGSDSTGKPFYGPDDARQLVERHGEEIGIKAVPFSELVYLPDEDRYEEAARAGAATRTLSLSGSQVRDEYLNRGRLLPAWFTRPEVAEILAETYP